MSREPASNIGFVQPQKPDPRFLKIPLEQFIGKYVKLGFPTKNPKHPQENMWVLVSDLVDVFNNPGEELRGTLDNDPLYAECKCGDEFEFSRSEILAALDL